MKIERINDNQIRCTLTREDLDHHQIRLSELAYGSEKARNLFQAMMQQAYQELGFEANNIPLMIEAIPVSSESIVLIITKVEDPEELDTRFSKFSPQKPSSEDTSLHLDGADNIIDIFQKIYEAKMKNSNQIPTAKNKKNDGDSRKEPSVNLIHRFTFRRLDDVIAASKGLSQFYDGINSLYKERETQNYILIIHQSHCTPQEFNKVCNILSEYGKGCSASPAGEAHLLEHEDIIISSNALQQLGQL